MVKGYWLLVKDLRQKKNRKDVAIFPDFFLLSDE